MATLAVLVALWLAVPGALRAGIDARMLRFPDVSAEQITFVYAGDVWVAPKRGGLAHRLSTPRGEETFPRFSPDGRQIAFSGNYDGNTDVYVVDVVGGLPRRLTHHPATDRMLDWYPDGASILFASSMASGTDRFRQLYRVSVAGGLPEKLPLPYGEFGAIGPDGVTLAYLPLTRDFRTWKRYRGGMASDIWLFDLERRTSKNATADPANDSQPMWHGRTLYFLSDRDENRRHNIWALDLDSGQTRQITQFDTLDVAFPAIGPQDIVFSVGGDLYRLELATERSERVELTVVTDRATLKPRRIDVAERIDAADISPSGKRAVFEARGEIFTVPAEHGVTRNLTRSSGVAERHPAWSPDGESIAYFSDRSGEYELVLRAADGSGAERRLTTLGPGYRYTPSWSPDGKRLVFVDQAMQVNLYEADSGRVSVIDRGQYLFHGGLSRFRMSWSADSRWIAWARASATRNRAIYLYDTRERTLHQATSGFYDDSSPVFDPDGKYLFFASQRTFEPSYGDFDNSWIYANSTNLVAAPLRDDVISPLAPRNDEEGQPDEDEDEERDRADGKKHPGKSARERVKRAAADRDETEPPAPVAIDLDGFERRLVHLPPKNGRYADLHAVSGKLVYRRLPRTGSASEDSPIVFYDLQEREEKTVLADADGFVVSGNGKKLLVVQERKFAIVELEPEQKMDEPLDLSGLAMELDPVAEWRQMFHDAWRFERDYFYDPRMHGVDWPAMRERYGALLEHVVTRWDLNFLLGELIAELNASHAYRGGGDTESESTTETGLLGVDFALEQGTYRIARIVDGAAWDSEIRSPLRRPGVDVDEGDYLLAINGVALDAARDPWAALQGLGGKTVLLTVNERPTPEGARDVLVETLTTEQDFRLRNLDWIETNRRKVEQATGGRVGYVYVPSTGVNGQTELVRMFQGQFAKEGLIIDERFNSGGQIPDRFVELLDRPLYNYWGVRDGTDWQWPPVSHVGPKAMLINAWSGSGGDALPFYFKQAGLGPLIGTRTWGGLIGISGAPQLIDGGVVTVPTFGMYGLDGQWLIEGYGVDPDIEVDDDPARMTDGGDPQLERAIAEVLRMLERAPASRPTRAPHPVRSGR